MLRKTESFLEMRGITKAFPGVLANDNITFAVQRGEVHGILGENGAGKTTLMNILFGLYRPDSGEIIVDGSRVEIKSPRKAVEFAIGMVHQHFKLVENLTALENVLLGLQQEHPPLLHKERARKRFRRLAEEYDLNINPDTPVWQLPVGDQQWLEILKLLFRNAQLLVLDEPTSVLAPAQSRKLFKTMRRLVSEGRSIIFISHKLDEVQEITDRITVLRDGSVIGTVNTPEATSAKLAIMMVGRPVSLDRRQRPDCTSNKEALTIRDLYCYSDRQVPAIRGVNLTVFSGEIVGIAGVDGNGQKELAECSAGIRRYSDGEIKICGITVNGVVSDVSKLGFIPEDRQKTGLIVNFSISENIVIKTITNQIFTRHGIVNWRKINKFSQSLIDQYSIKAPNSITKVGSLSGGNQQKVILARELNARPELLVCSQATRGLDLGATESLHEMLLAERNRGAGILFISTELSEVMSLSDRILVMFKGQVMGEIPGEGANLLAIGEMMLGRRSKEIEAIGGINVK